MLFLEWTFHKTFVEHYKLILSHKLYEILLEEPLSTSNCFFRVKKLLFSRKTLFVTYFMYEYHIIDLGYRQNVITQCILDYQTVFRSIILHFLGKTCHLKDILLIPQRFLFLNRFWPLGHHQLKSWELLK